MQVVSVFIGWEWSESRYPGGCPGGRGQPLSGAESATPSLFCHTNEYNTPLHWSHCRPITIFKFNIYLERNLKHRSVIQRFWFFQTVTTMTENIQDVFAAILGYNTDSKCIHDEGIMESNFHHTIVLIIAFFSSTSDSYVNPNYI